MAKFRHVDCFICCFINQSNQIASIHCCAFSLSVRLQSFSSNMDTTDVKNVLLALFIKHTGNLKTSKSQQLNAIVVRGRLCCGNSHHFWHQFSIALTIHYQLKDVLWKTAQISAFFAVLGAKKLVRFSHFTDDASFHFCENFVE